MGSSKVKPPEAAKPAPARNPPAKKSAAPDDPAKPAKPRPRARVAAGTIDRLGQRALRRLAWLMMNASSETAQVAAAKELLDRVHGRPNAPLGPGTRHALDDVVTQLRELRSNGNGNGGNGNGHGH